MPDTCPETPLSIMFAQVTGLQSDGLRSRVRRFESCWGRFFENLIEKLLLIHLERFVLGATAQQTVCIEPPLSLSVTRHSR